MANMGEIINFALEEKKAEFHEKTTDNTKLIENIC